MLDTASLGSYYLAGSTARCTQIGYWTALALGSALSNVGAGELVGSPERALSAEAKRELDCSVPKFCLPEGIVMSNLFHPTSMPALRLTSVTKTYGSRSRRVQALDGISVAVPHGSFTAVMGPSGSGKSTFLHCSAGLDRPTSGDVRVGDTDLARLKENDLTRLRRSKVGFVFQAFNLVSSLTVGQNIELPSRFSGQRVGSQRVGEALAQVGLSGYERRRPAELSGGQQQRVAIARALVTRPEVVFADEPTGALDSVAAQEILHVLQDCVNHSGQTVIMVTHDPIAASFADAVMFLADGLIVDQMSSPTSDRVAARMTTLGAWV